MSTTRISSPGRHEASSASATESGTFILPPTRALWIPAAVRHETSSAADTTMRAVYVSRSAAVPEWTLPTAIAVTPLLAELIGYLGSDPAGPQRHSAESLVVELLSPVAVATIDVRMPESRSARRVADALVADPADARTLTAWGRWAGSSERSLARAFLAETGLPFGRWRTLVRLRAALLMLAAGESLTAVALHAGYASTSAFVAAFRRETGMTPRSYATVASSRSAATSSSGVDSA